MRDATTGFSGDHVRDPCNHYFGAWDQGESELISGTWTPHQPFNFAMDRLHARSKRIRGSINPPPSRASSCVTVAVTIRRLMVPSILSMLACINRHPKVFPIGMKNASFFWAGRRHPMSGETCLLGHRANKFPRAADPVNFPLPTPCQGCILIFLERRDAAGRKSAPTPCSPSIAAPTETAGLDSSIGRVAASQPLDQT